ncbi:Lnb N-terminal periplasmic domain-containing protein [Methylomonas rosea]|uniref:DUF4105 domain-containing protein n=1 Tax=Methylomonas rosea TaxID=2952227 RepID=A0ABT1TPN8_9GAMM|nr:DUF4105 domain-containing protein [Methylomonas sp. WSC-7]MCQ8116728.1 DUF4105 domain-containing protein [Methylomonas sp. WSC-7]
MIAYLFALVAVLISTLWGACSIYFGDSHTGGLQQVLALFFGLIGCVTAIGLLAGQWRRSLLTVYFIGLSGILIWWLNIAPSNDRQWQADAQHLAHASFVGNLVTVHNIRNFSYKSEFDYQPNYYDKTFDLNKLEGIDLFSVYWMGPAFAHTILSFHFAGDDYLAVSIEARKEIGEGYSTVKGFFRQYELIYVVADERDVIGLRANHRNNPPEHVYWYRLQGSHQNAKNLFLEYMNKINQLNEQPTFYNTLLDNCTTAIWWRTRVNAEHLPFSWKVLLSGYLPEYLYETGHLDNGKPFDELQKRALINDLAHAADHRSDFSTRIRTVEQQI